MERYLHSIVKKSLGRKIIFLGGPRQVGKTTFSFQLLGKGAGEEHPAYLSWDFPKNRKMLMEGVLPAGQKLIVLDEIHKYRQWRNLVKGLYDKNKSRFQFLVTGSAKLDYYRRGGDSLAGRYEYYRLHPLSLYEISSKPTKEQFKRLLAFGGFPEMYLEGNRHSWKKWQRMRLSQLIRDDLVSLEQVRDVSQVETLASLLQERVASTLSLDSLRRDLSCSHHAIRHWMDILENIYHCYRIYPYGASLARALKKEAKLYLWDWSPVENEGARFENMVASNLLKYCHYHEDIEGDRMELRFLRDREKREVDFVVLKNNRPLFAVECKRGERSVSRHIAYYAKRTDIPLFYQVHKQGPWHTHGDIRCESMGFVDFCTQVLKV